MEQTNNHQLSQWDAEDRILREDFNRDNLKIDAALGEQGAELVALTAAVALCGNCQIYKSGYTGSGSYGADKPCSHTFPKKPLFVCIVDHFDGGIMQAVQGVSIAYKRLTNGVYLNTSWNGNTMSWHATNAAVQMNEYEHTYTIIALLSMDAQ